MIICGLCGSHNVVKKGMRHNASGSKQKFFCHDCQKWYVHDDEFKRMRINPVHIVRALHEYGAVMFLLVLISCLGIIPRSSVPIGIFYFIDEKKYLKFVNCGTV